jgi:hypothetical protein
LGWVQQFEFFVTIAAAFIKQVAPLTTPHANSGTRDEWESKVCAAREKNAPPRAALRIYFFERAPRLSANSCNDTVKSWCGATTVVEESSARLAIDQMFTDNARNLFIGSCHVESAFCIVDFVRCRRGAAWLGAVG